MKNSHKQESLFFKLTTFDRKGRREMVNFNAMKVFSATKARERGELGEEITRWMEENPEVEVMNTEIRQSSDSEFHCLSIIVFYNKA